MNSGSSLLLYVLCISVLMIILDTTIVTVALPSIVADLGISGISLTWILNAYMLTFGGFLLLSGRLGDIYGQRRLFLAGIAVFTAASLGCGLARSEAVLLIARGLQGLGGAVVSVVSLSLIMDLSVEPVARARAMGIYGFVCAAGGGIGELLGGLLAGTLGWQWIFIFNVPIGIAVYLFCIILLPRDGEASKPRQVDLAGAIVVTTAVTLIVYATVDGHKEIGTSMQSWGLLLGAAFLLLFLMIEIRAREPLVPLHMFQLRSFATSNLLSVLWSAGSFAWFVIAALYLQRVLGYGPLGVGLAFMPSSVIMGAFSVCVSAKMVERFGVREPIWVGLLLAACGLAWFARAPVDGVFLVDVLPGMVLLGLGGGMAEAPLLLAAMEDVKSDESGIASGILNTAFMLGGALGLAVLSAVAEIRFTELNELGVERVAAINGGYHLAFCVAALLNVAGAVLGALVLRPCRSLAEPTSGR